MSTQFLGPLRSRLREPGHLADYFGRDFFQPLGAWGGWNLLGHTEKAVTPLDSAGRSILFPARSYLNRDGNTSDCGGEPHRHVSLQSTNNYLILLIVLVKAKTFLHIFSLKSHFLVQREIKVPSLSSSLKGFQSRHLKAYDCHALLIPGLGDNILKENEVTLF